MGFFDGCRGPVYIVDRLNMSRRIWLGFDLEISSTRESGGYPWWAVYSARILMTETAIADGPDGLFR